MEEFAELLRSLEPERIRGRKSSTTEHSGPSFTDLAWRFIKTSPLRLEPFRNDLRSRQVDQAVFTRLGVALDQSFQDSTGVEMPTARFAPSWHRSSSLSLQLQTLEFLTPCFIKHCEFHLFPNLNNDIIAECSLLARLSRLA